jgi:Uma2 family endonuclease
MPVLILDPWYAEQIRTKRQTESPNARDEVWDGVLVMPPLPNIEHQIMVTDLSLAFAAVIDRAAGDLALAGANVSDRNKDWENNYREPDVLVVLHTNPAKNRGTHWVGGPDLAVEIVSPGEDPRQKLDFYAKVKTREVLVIDRDPWAVELYRLKRGKLVLVGKSDLADPAVLASAALPLTFQLKAGKPRPTILVSHTANKQTWTA